MNKLFAASWAPRFARTTPNAALVSLCLLALACWWPSLAFSQSQPVDLIRLRDVVCTKIETLGHPHPEYAVGDGGKSWGECQIQYATAVRAGAFSKDANPGLLFDGNVNRLVALNILVWCAQHRGRHTVRGLAACYHTPNRPSDDYARRVEAAYKRR